MSKSNRPWQGTVLGILNAIGVFISLMASLAFLFAGAALTPYLQDSPLSILAGAGTAIIGIVFIFFVILGLFLTLGIFKGQRWAIIVSLILIGLNLISTLVSFNIPGIIINGLVFYLAFACIKDTYYK